MKIASFVPNMVLPLRLYEKEERLKMRSFGTQKQHYSLAKVKAGNRATETLWIFFGIHTANAICMIEKRYKKIVA